MRGPSVVPRGVQARDAGRGSPLLGPRRNEVILRAVTDIAGGVPRLEAMHALTEDQLRASFRNAEPDELAEIAMPHDLLLAEWDYLDFFAWRDPIATRSGYIVIEQDGEAVGIVLRAADPSRVRSGMCNLCHTMQPGNQVALFAARRGGPEGRKGSVVGTYICADLSCYESVRLAPRRAPNEVRAERLADRRLDGTHRRVHAFVASVLGDAA